MLFWICWNRKIRSGDKSLSLSFLTILSTWQKHFKHSLHPKSQTHVYERSINKQESSDTVCLGTTVTCSLWINTVATNAILAISLSNSLTIV